MQIQKQYHRLPFPKGCVESFLKSILDHDVIEKNSIDFIFGVDSFEDIEDDMGCFGV